MMKIAALADVKAHLSAYVNACESEGPVIITRNGRAAPRYCLRPLRHKIGTGVYRGAQPGEILGVLGSGVSIDLLGRRFDG